MTLEHDVRGITKEATVIACAERLAAAYRVHRQIYADPTGSELRASLRKMRGAAGVLFEWLADAGNLRTLEHRAAKAAQSVAMERGDDFTAAIYGPSAGAMTDTLAIMIRTAEATEKRLTYTKRRNPVPRIMAEAMIAELPPLGFPVTSSNNSPACRLLVAIAWAAGDRSLTLDAAQKAIKAARRAKRT